MQIVGRINLPKSADVTSLYIQCSEDAALKYYNEEQEIVCRCGGVISSNTYFNSFYESFYSKYTELDSIYYLLKLQGDFQVAVYREIYGGSERSLISQETFKNCQLTDDVKIRLPNLQQQIPQGRIYFELECLSEQGIFTQGLIATEQQQNREVSLAVISCTYKKEAYIKKTVNTLLEDKFLQTKKFKFFVVDNGKTLSTDDFEDPRVQLIFNRNLGGSGGFTKGLVAALQENTATHFVFMDDDIELDSESIYRLFALYEYAKCDFAVAGSMLDLAKKCVLYEAGALYSKNHKTMEVSPFVTAPLKHNLDLQNATNLNLLLLEEDVDYGAFWLFAVSKEVVEEIGLPLPFFIKVDDIEFCLRIKQKVENKEIVAFPSIAVWHEPFYLKFTVWDTYYWFRNNLIAHAIHRPLEYTETVKNFTRGIIFSLLWFEYNFAEMRIKAFEDYLKGPNFLKNIDAEDLHTNVLKLSKSFKTQTVQSNYLPLTERDYPKPKARTWKKIVSLLTLNGHLLPNFLIREDVFLWITPEYPNQRSRAFAKKRVLIFNEESSCLVQNEIDKRAGINLLIRWFKLAATSSMRWSSVSKEWKTASSELTSTQFWEQYLGMKK